MFDRLDIRKYYSEEHGLLKNNPLLGMEAQHASLELTGKYLTAVALGAIEPDTEIIHKLIATYKRFWLELGFIPRTISYVMTDGMKTEAKGDVWKYHSPLGFYFNTATSTTQTMHLIMSLYLSGEVVFAHKIMESFVNKWAIRYRGDVVVNGSFFPVGITGLQRYIICKILGISPGFIVSANLSLVGTWTKFPRNYIVAGKKLDEGEWWGAVQWLLWLAKLGKEKHLEAFLPKHRDRLRVWLESRLANTNDGDYLRDFLNYQILTKIIQGL